MKLLLATLLTVLAATSLRADDDSALEGKMKILARGTRQLAQQISNPAMQQDNINLLETLKKAVLESKSCEPQKIREIPEAKRASFLSDYKTDLDELSDVFDQIENAVKSGDYAKAQSLLSSVNSIKKEAHSKFKAD